MHEAAPEPEQGIHSRRLAAYVVPLLLSMVLMWGIAAKRFGEVYPFADWGMFSSVPSRVTYYTLLVHEVEGRPLDAPELVIHLPEFQANFRSAAGFRTMVDFCRAAEKASKDPKSISNFAKARSKAEAMLSGKKVTYELVEIFCNPRDFYRDGIATGGRSYGLFRTGEAIPAAQMPEHAPRPMGAAS